MTNDTLLIIAETMDELGIPYDFMTYRGDVPETYFTGEYIPTDSMDESGFVETQFILNGFTEKTYAELETAKNKIKERFPRIEGYTAITEHGTGVAIFYDSAFPIDLEAMDLKRIQINLTVKEWEI